MSNSSLVSYTKISPNRTKERKYEITRITPHCVVGQLSIESLGEIFAPTSKEASSNYGIGSDGRVGMYVEEKDRSWCSSSSDNDNRAITIECASDIKYPYAFNNVVFSKLIDLCVDICKRNGKTKLLWLGGKTKALEYKPKSNEMILTAHRWFSKTECPGEWMYSRMGELAEEVNEILSDKKTNLTKSIYRVRKTWADAGSQIGAFASLENAKALVKKNPSFKVYDGSGKMVYYIASKTTSNSKKSIETIAKEVIAGKWGNGETRKKKLKAAGYDYNAVQKKVNQLLK